MVPHAANLEWPGRVTTYGWEIIDHATSVAMHNIPMYHHCGDLLKINNAFIKKILSERNYDLVLVTAGFPCQDNSSLNTGGKDIQGKKSGLIFSICKNSGKNKRYPQRLQAHIQYPCDMGKRDRDNAQ